MWGIYHCVALHAPTPWLGGFNNHNAIHSIELLNPHRLEHGNRSAFKHVARWPWRQGGGELRHARQISIARKPTLLRQTIVYISQAVLYRIRSCVWVYFLTFCVFQANKQQQAMRTTERGEQTPMTETFCTVQYARRPCHNDHKNIHDQNQ